MAHLFSLPLLSFFLLLATAGNAVVSPGEVYWKTVLLNTPIPNAIKDHFHPNGTNIYRVSGYSDYYTGATPAELNDKAVTSMFFLEKDLLPGAKMSPLFTTSTSSGGPFLPRRVSDAIPFSSEKLPQILDRFSLKPGSVEAEATRDSLGKCEDPAVDGGLKLCATSLESMVEFATSVLGTHDVRAMSTSSEGESHLRLSYPGSNSHETHQLLVGANNALRKADSTRFSLGFHAYPLQYFQQQQQYTYTVVSGKLVGSKLVACHPVGYPYAVFYCHGHGRSELQGYMLEMAPNISAVAVCHRDTSEWDPKSVPLQFFGVKPGGASVCHFMPRDHVIWVPAPTN